MNVNDFDEFAQMNDDEFHRLNEELADYRFAEITEEQQSEV